MMCEWLGALVTLSVLYRAGELLCWCHQVFCWASVLVEHAALRIDSNSGPCFQPHHSPLSSNPPSSLFWLLSDLTMEVLNVHAPERIIIDRKVVGNQGIYLGNLYRRDGPSCWQRTFFTAMVSRKAPESLKWITKVLKGNWQGEKWLPFLSPKGHWKESVCLSGLSVSDIPLTCDNPPRWLPSTSLSDPGPDSSWSMLSRQKDWLGRV